MLTIIELSMFCTSCHDICTVIGVKRGIHSPLFRSPHYSLRFDRANSPYFIHRPGHCGGKLTLIGAQEEIQRQHTA